MKYFHLRAHKLVQEQYEYYEGYFIKFGISINICFTCILIKGPWSLKSYWALQLTLLYFSAQVLPESGKRIRGDKDSIFSRLLDCRALLYSS